MSYADIAAKGPKQSAEEVSILESCLLDTTNIIVGVSLTSNFAPSLLCAFHYVIVELFTCKKPHRSNMKTHGSAY
jgi:hypothetical protein